MSLSFIRAWLLALLATVLLLSADPTVAAPTCQDKHGLTIKCGTPGAMPVGWSLPFEERPFKPPATTISQWVMLIGTLGLLFGLIAFLPEFDGTRDSDWDRQDRDS
jgi:hypothetical protein